MRARTVLAVPLAVFRQVVDLLTAAAQLTTCPVPAAVVAQQHCWHLQSATPPVGPQPRVDHHLRPRAARPPRRTPPTTE
ncbi:hypothetical protein [Streptomyces niger]|uniref:hypothetical protein n=1 Tax=Streptomyces niger TaxID=66373 RepID=UPI00069BF3CE|nr:hypothetical protein [Streptomyces niger]